MFNHISCAMPESPEAQVCASMLKYLNGRRLKNVTYKGEMKAIDEDLIEVLAIGKKVYFIFLSVTVVVSFGMTGNLLQRHNGYVKGVFRFEGMKLYYCDVRDLGKLEVIENVDIDEYLSNMGPCYLNSDVTEDEWIEAIKLRTRSTTTLSSFLMNQHIFSGIGNYIRSEVLYLAKIHPERKIIDINDKDLRKVFNCILKVMRKSINMGGHTIKDYRRPDGSIGNYSCYIYGKQEAKQLVQNGRKVYYDPKRQR